MPGLRRKDIVGQVFGFLTVTAFDRVADYGQTYWRCMCHCGTETVVRKSHLKDGGTKSCGCERGALIGEARTTHGHWKNGKGTPEYSAWMLARVRCHVPSNHAYKGYGARGIVMCDRWRFGEDGKSGFECFIADMGPRPESGTLDRTDNDKGYSPENCRWVSMKVQGRNRRGNKIVEFDGRSMCVSEAAELAGIKPGLVYQRLNRGWPVEAALNQSVGRNGPRPKE
jgi:hypothetical protein